YVPHRDLEVSRRLRLVRPHRVNFRGLPVSTSSFRSLKRTSIGPPAWICNAKMPRRETFGSSRSTQRCPLMYVFTRLPWAMILYSFHSSTLTYFSPDLSHTTPRPCSSYNLPHQPAPTSACGPFTSPSGNASLRNCTPLFSLFGTSFTFSVRRKSAAIIRLFRNSFLRLPGLLPPISPFSTFHSLGLPSQPVRSLPLNRSRALSAVARIGTCLGWRR